MARKPMWRSDRPVVNETYEAEKCALVGQQDSSPVVIESEEWMRAERARLSRSSPVAEPIDYMLKRWDGFTTFLSDGRICLTNNAPNGHRAALLSAERR